MRLSALDTLDGGVVVGLGSDDLVELDGLIAVDVASGDHVYLVK